MTIIPRGNKFGVKVHDPKAKGNQRWVGTYATRREARAAEREAEMDVAAGRGKQRRTTMTVAEYQERWLDVHCNHLEDSTLLVYRSASRHLVRDFGHAPLGTISRTAAVNWCQDKPQKARQTARLIYAHALDEGLVLANPFDRIRVKGKAKGGRGGDNLVVLTEPELQDLTQACETVFPGEFGRSFAAMVTFAAYTGMRPGEMFALKWENILQETNRVHVKASISSTGRVKTPKNGKSRLIALPPQAKAVLPSLYRLDNRPWVFLSRSGKRFSRDSFLEVWRPVRQVAGVPIKDFYELRHFCATHLLNCGLLDREVAVQLGHTDGGEQVRKTYGHPDKDPMLDRVFKAFEQGQA